MIVRLHRVDGPNPSAFNRKSVLILIDFGHLVSITEWGRDGTHLHLLGGDHVYVKESFDFIWKMWRIQKMGVGDEELGVYQEWLKTGVIACGS